VRSFRTGKFKTLFRELPPDIQAAARKAYQLWRADPRHPSLHFKPIRNDAWSARISLGYRAVGFIRGEDIYWHWIGKHADYDKLIKGL
jgi:hypothetical protein